jgi:hypothetical protein
MDSGNKGEGFLAIRREGACRGRDSPRRITPVLAGKVQAQDIPIGITKIGFTPHPDLVGGRRVKFESARRQLLKRRIQIVALKINDDAGVRCHQFDLMKGKRRSSGSAFKAGIRWQVTDDLSKAKGAIERGGARDVGGRQ